MNMLNSIILEGTIQEDILFKETDGVKTASFKIGVDRTELRPDGTKGKVTSSFEVVTYGTMAESTNKFGVKGRGVHVIGRLKQEDSRVFVVGEHIEYKPL